MPRLLFLTLTLLALGGRTARADDQAATLVKGIQAVGKEGAGSPAARAAWDRLVALGPGALPRVLEAMDTPNTVVANWLGTAFDRIAERDLQAGGKGIDAGALLAYAQEPKHQGRTRRLALELVDRLRPGTSDKLIPGWLEDPEFCFEAVAVALKQADALAKGTDKSKAAAAYRKALASARDVQQVREAAAALQKLGATVSAAGQLGFLTDWYLIGPFDAMGMKGFKTVYPPEENIDLAAEYPGKAGKVRWKRYQLREPPPTAGGHAALISLREADALGDADDAVAYAYTAFTVPRACAVEFRGAADDNFTVWVNGKREFGHEEYRNGVRLDRHRFHVKLRAGLNTVLVKIVQAPVDTTNPQANWEFFLRAVDVTGKGIEMKDALPQKAADPR
jgi:hypothetical protein